MSNIITVGFSVEGNSDRRLLEAIIKNTFEEVALNCSSAIEVYDPFYFKLPEGNSYADRILALSKLAFEAGMQVLCIHADADSDTDSNTFKHKIHPSIQALNRESSLEICRLLVPIVPIYMSESWLLADKDLFKEEIGTTKSNDELGISRDPETIANPKAVIAEALRIAQDHLPNRRRKLTIDEIYQPLGQNLNIEKLLSIPSFVKFRDAVTQAYRDLNFIY